MALLVDLNDENITNNDIFVTVDMTCLCTNIDQSEGVKAVKELLEKHSDNKMKNIFILELMKLVLSQNIY